jgi:hypothetical protein
VDGGAVANLMLYSLFKKLGGLDDEMIKTNMTVSGVGGGGRWELKASSLWCSPLGARRWL